MEKAERFLSHMMDQNTSRGIAAVRRIKQQRNLPGIYGTVAELFTVHERFQTAVEVTAGNSLFHYVVDTDETATKVLEILQEQKAGRVTFMPLNRLQNKPVNLPQANDALDMMTKLTFEPQYEKALRHVFGRTIICPNLQVAAQYARSHQVNAITPDGDRSDKKGALTGGYHDPRQSRLEGMQNMKKWRDEYDEQQARSTEIRHEVERKDQEITRSVNDVLKAEQKQQKAENSYAPLQQELRNKQAELQSRKARLEREKKAKANVESALKELADQQAAFEAEKKTEFKKALTTAEEQQLDTLTTSIPDLRRAALSASTTRSELEGEKSTLEVELEENLRPRLDQLNTADNDTLVNSTSSSGNLKDLQGTLKQLTQKLTEADKKLRNIETSTDTATAQVSELEKQRAEHRTQQEDLARQIEKQQKRAEKSIGKRALLTSKLTETNRNIRDLGQLSNEAFTAKYTRIASDKALKRLATLRESLKKYSHVNKKAFEQYTSFTRQRETLQKRRSELDTGYDSINELIATLDQRKDEAIERTFKQVSREFANIFERLVPAGRGRLIIQRRTDQSRDAEANPDDSDEEAAERARRKQGSNVENYTGVGISVSFNSKFDEQQRIQQLSGGQKSLCALALVFAIQRCDPAPFYLFDEIDANLDAQYRTAVAQLLKEISGSGSGSGGRRGGGGRQGTEEEEEHSAQFICTTFRPEMLHVAEKCYGVSYASKTSRIDAVGREEALEFVEGIVGGN